MAELRYKRVKARAQKVECPNIVTVNDQVPCEEGKVKKTVFGSTLSDNLINSLIDYNFYHTKVITYAPSFQHY